MKISTRSALLLLLVAVSAFVAAPAFAAPPFGSLGGKVGGGNAGTGQIPIHGWALDDGGVAAVDIYVDGRPAGRAIYGLARPGVGQRYPGFPDSNTAGFHFSLDSTRYLNGNHKVEARVTALNGERSFLNPVTLQFTNTTHILAPFGEIEFPNSSAELYGSCDLLTPRRLNVISGWALDAGIEEGDLGVGYVELLIDGGVYANSRLDCRNDPEKGVLTDCYGLRRLDVEENYPYLRDSPLSGYRFVIDVGDLVDPQGAWGYTQGRHVLTIRVGDISGQVRNIDEIPVTFLCADRNVNDQAIGWIGPPRPSGIGSGIITVSGWALDFEGVDKVSIQIDGRHVANAIYGLPRGAVSAQYPGFPNSSAPAWELNVDTTRLSDGRHHIQAEVFDLEGVSTLIGEREFVVDNP